MQTSYILTKCAYKQIKLLYMYSILFFYLCVHYTFSHNLCLMVIRKQIGFMLVKRGESFVKARYLMNRVKWMNSMKEGI